MLGIIIVSIIIIRTTRRGGNHGITSFEVREILTGCIVDNEGKAHERENYVKLVYDRNVIMG